MIIGRIYNTLIRKHKDAVSFIALFFFLLSFIISRTYIYLNTAGLIPDSLFLNRNIRGVHIHHFALGIIILTIAGYLALNFSGQRVKHYIAALYGIGLGLSYDEFGMWLRLKDDYWIRQSYDALAVIFVILVNIVYFGNLWQKIFLKVVTFFLRLIHSHFVKARFWPLLRFWRAKLKPHQYA